MAREDEVESVDDRPAQNVGLINGLLVVLVPLVVLLVGSSLAQNSNTSVTVRAYDAPATRLLMMVIPVVVLLSPFGCFAGWRSTVYARRWRDHQDRGWRAVAEAGACGFSLALISILPGIVMRPVDAPPYVIAYGGGALVLGLLVGLFLRMTAIVVLRFYKPVTAKS